ncbi:MAG: hypothetical protein EOO77_30810, partial [Oxalobacteraceae bacterium]
VMLSHGNLLSSALGVLASEVGRSGPRYLHSAPLFHVGGLSGLVQSMISGSRGVLLPEFVPQTVLEVIEREQRVVEEVARTHRFCDAPYKRAGAYRRRDRRSEADSVLFIFPDGERGAYEWITVHSPRVAHFAAPGEQRPSCKKLPPCSER